MEAPAVEEVFVVRRGYNFAGLGILLGVAFLFVGGVQAFDVLRDVLRHPSTYSYAYVGATYFYAATVGAPLWAVLWVFDFASRLTPWHNMNFVLGLAASAAYLLSVPYLLVRIWAGGWKAVNFSPKIMFFLPAILAFAWFCLTSLSQVVLWLFH